MEKIEIEATPSTPNVLAEPGKGLTIKGRSLPEDPVTFYAPIIKWCKNYLNPGDEILFKLEYFNTSTSKIIYNILKVAEESFEKGLITVHWHYEEGDEDGHESGLLYQDELPGLKFNFHEFSEMETL